MTIAYPHGGGALASTEQMDTDAWGDAEAATVAVVAHGLLNSMAAVQALVEAVLRGYDQHTDDQRRALLERASELVLFNLETLDDLVRALPMGVARFTERLDAALPRRTQSEVAKEN
jgi:hypothetical protein